MNELRTMQQLAGCRSRNRHKGGILVHHPPTPETIHPPARDNKEREKMVVFTLAV